MLLMDCVGSATLWLNESKLNEIGNSVRFRGKFQEANSKNKNNRIYPYDVLNTNLERLQEAVENRGLVGELDHPTDSIIHFENCSHLITRLWWEGNVLMGEGEVLPTPNGMVLRKLIESKVRVGISSRGVGNGQTNGEGSLVIGESYRLITFDAVADPSTFSAFQQRVTSNENKTYLNKDYNKANIEQQLRQVESVKQYVNPDALISYLGALFETKCDGFKVKK
jgi:hypothetical protein